MNNTEFYNLIHYRGVTTAMLCRQADCGRVHLTEVLNGRRGGRYTWPKLRGVLDDREYECAFRYAHAERVRLADCCPRLPASRVPSVEDVQHNETKFHVEQTL